MHEEMKAIRAKAQELLDHISEALGNAPVQADTLVEDSLLSGNDGPPPTHG
jgi:hypothetical protein